NKINEHVLYGRAALNEVNEHRTERHCGIERPSGDGTSRVRHRSNGQANRETIDEVPFKLLGSRNIKDHEHEEKCPKQLNACRWRCTEPRAGSRGEGFPMDKEEDPRSKARAEQLTHDVGERFAY